METCGNTCTCADCEAKRNKNRLIDKLLGNDITLQELGKLQTMVNANDLSVIIQRIYDLNEKHIHSLSAVEGILKKLNQAKNVTRNGIFFKKIKKGFRSGKNCKVILAEGDSWFNYPVILTDVIDWISMEENLSVYSIASGGDWLLNMLEGKEYVEELSLLHPDYFLISGGGNDIVGAKRVAAIVDPLGNSTEYHKNEWVQELVTNATDTYVTQRVRDLELGASYLSKDFFALLMFFHLQYYFLMNGILCGGSEEPGAKGKFPGIKIITQGYDYPIPSSKKQFGLNPLKWYVPFIRQFLGHSIWLKTPLQMRGINDQRIQECILFSMIYLFNEAMINLGDIFNIEKNMPGSVFHIDSRESVTATGWTDELHPLPEKFRNTGLTFIDCINGKSPNYRHVFVVKKLHP